VKRKQNLNQKYEPPEGKMLHPYQNNRLVKISTVQKRCIERINVYIENGYTWKDDDSYNWAEEVKAKRGQK